MKEIIILTVSVILSVYITSRITLKILEKETDKWRKDFLRENQIVTNELIKELKKKIG